jgi:hypothetical protein
VHGVPLVVQRGPARVVDVVEGAVVVVTVVEVVVVEGTVVDVVVVAGAVVVVDVVDVVGDRVVLVDVDVVVTVVVVGRVVDVVVAVGRVVVVVAVGGGHAPTRGTHVRKRMSLSCTGLPVDMARTGIRFRPGFPPITRTGTSVKAPHAESAPAVGTGISPREPGGLRNRAAVQSGALRWFTQRATRKVQTSLH